jgi:hypothetical protein
MFFWNGSFKSPPMQARTVSGLALLLAVATGLAQLAGKAPAWRFDSAVQHTSDLAVATGMGWTLFQLAVHRTAGRERSRWALAAGAMGVLGALQVTDWLVSSGVMTDDWLFDLPLWIVATVMVRTVLRRGRQRTGALPLWWLGMVLQCVFIVCDFWDGKSLVGWPISSDGLASLAEWSELLAIECYVGALVLVGAARGVTGTGTGSAPSRPTRAVGAEARRIYEQANLFQRANYPPLRLAFWPGSREALLVLVCMGLVAVLGRAARRASGRTQPAQLADLLRLSLCRGFDPLAYYFQEIYREDGRSEAPSYLTRRETKNGLFNVLNGMRRSPDGPHEMKDKALFAACCRREGLPVPQTLFQSTGGHGNDGGWVPREELDRDLFCKLRSGRGAQGALVFRRVAPHRYRDPDDNEMDLDGLLARVEASSRMTPLIVQPRLRNHPELADLADQSLVTIRVLTCLDAEEHPVATHAFLRILSKLEPDWHRKDEYGVPIDLDSGRLGAMVSDRLAGRTVRLSHHPVTGKAVEGRVLHTWPAIRTLALEAHRSFAHRIIVGWDIAVTDDGPVLLEGNVNLDVTFPQRVYRQGIGRSPLGPLLRHHLDALAKSHDVD